MHTKKHSNALPVHVGARTRSLLVLCMALRRCCGLQLRLLHRVQLETAHGIRSGPQWSCPRVAQLRMEAMPSAAALREAWDRGTDATVMRPLVEACKGESRAAAIAASGNSGVWRGLWLARIEHFEKVRPYTGLRLRPYYEFGSGGEIVSHIHVALGPLRAWVSASGVMRPAQDGTAKVMLDFDDFWVAGDTPRPRDAPTGGDASQVDKLVTALGRALFFEGLASFPVDHVDLEGGIVAFRFTFFDSCIVSRREPDGATPQPVPLDDE